MFYERERKFNQEECTAPDRRYLKKQQPVIQMCPIETFRRGDRRRKSKRREFIRRRPSPFLRYLTERRQQYLNAYPDAKPQDILGSMENEWKEMHAKEKLRYIEMAKEYSYDESEDSDPDYTEGPAPSSRMICMGPTPSKSSNVGKQVIANMLNQNIMDDDTWLAKDDKGKVYLETLYEPNRRFYLDNPEDAIHLDMGHLYDAVTFWNEIGRYTGARSACVRAFMHDPNNYLIQYGRRNCALAPHVKYKQPANKIIENFVYEPCRTVGDKTNFASMKAKLRMMLSIV